MDPGGKLHSPAVSENAGFATLFIKHLERQIDRHVVRLMLIN